jgi:hypothetical protein
MFPIITKVSKDHTPFQPGDLEDVVEELKIEIPRDTLQQSNH